MKSINKIILYCDDDDYKRFKKWLIDNGLNQNQFAKFCGTNDCYISRIIKGKSSITNKAIKLFKKGGFELVPPNNQGD